MENPTLRWVFLFDKIEHFLPDFPPDFLLPFLGQIYIYIIYLIYLI